MKKMIVKFYKRKRMMRIHIDSREQKQRVMSAMFL